MSTSYDILESSSRSLWKDDQKNSLYKKVNLGVGLDVEGPLYNETMCLIHSGEPGDHGSARLCAQDVPFIYADFEMDVNSY